MVIKVKEITISRGRKFAWNYGNGVGYNVSITVEGTTAKDTLEDMRKEAISALMPLETEEQTRCKDVMEIAELQEGIEFKEAVDNTVETTKYVPKEPAVKKAEPDIVKDTLEIIPEGQGLIKEEVLMDLKEVTTLAHTDKAYLVTKKGKQKWIPISTIEGGDPELEDGTYCEELYLKDSAKWIEKKGWDKLEVRKK